MNYQGPGVYFHYKGSFYAVLGLTTHTETKEICVVYCCIDPGKTGIWHRPLTIFNEVVTPDGPGPRVAGPRFKKVSD